MKIEFRVQEIFMKAIGSSIPLINIHNIRMHYPETKKDRQSALRERVLVHSAFLAARVRRPACEPYCRLAPRAADSWQLSRSTARTAAVELAS